jgi:hypothetical protein
MSTAVVLNLIDMEKRKDLTKRYSFPSVNITEIIRTPVSEEVEWRNVIGVAAPFSKGPQLARINGNRKEIIALFGEDQSVGSLFIQQAMLQGASDFVISRVLPESKAAYGAISITPATNSTFIEPMVNQYGKRTTGLKFKASMISKFQPSPSSYSGYQTYNGEGTELEVYTNVKETPSISVEGVGYFDLKGLETVAIKDLEDQKILTDRKFKILDPKIVSGYHKIKFDSDATVVDSQDDEINQLIQSIKPGLVLTAGSDLTISAQGLSILSYPQRTTTGQFEVLVYGDITNLGVDPVKTLKVALPSSYSSDSSYTVVGVKYRNSNLNQLSGVLVYPNTDYLGYLIAPHNSYSGTQFEIYYYTLTGSGASVNITQIPTGVKVAFGADPSTNAIARTSNKLSGTITFFNTEVSIGDSDPAKGFKPGKSILSIYSELRDGILGNQALSNIFNEVDINDSKLPYSLSFSLLSKSTLGNDVRYAVELIKEDTNVDDLNITNHDIYQNMTGGTDSLKSAAATFYDVRGNAILYVKALSPGSAGNNIAVNIKPIKDGEFILEAFETNTAFNNTSLPLESYYLSNLSADVESGVYPDTLSSNLIRAYFIPLVTATSELEQTIYEQLPIRIAPPDITITRSDDLSMPIHINHRGESFLQNIKLSGGAEPTNYTTESLTEDDYVVAIDRLKEEDVAVIAAPGIYAGDTRYTEAINALVTQAEESNAYVGLRLALVSTPPRISVSKARIISNAFNSDRIVLLAGHSRIAAFSGNSNKLASSEGFYAGFIVNTPPYMSPAAQSTSPLNGVISLDTNYTLDDLDSLTKFNIEVLHLDPVTKVYKFLNGRTTSATLAERWVSIRRQADHIIMNLFRNLQWAKAMPNDEDLRARVASACDAFLKYEKSRGHITDYRPTIADKSVNSAVDTLTGNLNVLLRYIPVVPADYINLTVIRDFSTQFTLNV